MIRRTDELTLDAELVIGMEEGGMRLTSEEQEWLDADGRALGEKFPGVVEEVIVFGSKARGDAGPDSDLDVLVILREGDKRRKKEVRRLGHGVAAVSDAVPSIMVYTREEWSLRRQGNSPFYGAIVRDGVRVA